MFEKIINKFLHNFEKYVMVFMTMVSVLFALYGVFFRYVIRSSRGWVEEVCGIVLLFVVLLGLSAGTKENKHMKVDLFTPDQLSIKKRKLTISFLFIIDFITLFILFILGIFYVKNLFLRRITLVSVPWIPLWVPVLIMPIGFFLSLIRSVQRFICQFRENSS